MNVYTFNPQYKPIIWGGNRIASLKQVSIDIPNVGESWEISSVPGNESVVAEGCEDAGLPISRLIEKYGADLLGSDVFKEGDYSFPLLIKFIDAQRDLSVQVHPNDDLARERHNSTGKTEMWYILYAAPEAKIYCGLSAPLTPEGYRKCVADNSIRDYVATYKSEPGQFYLVPSGTIHAIGAGNLVAEIQQTSDVSYRVYDYNRLDTDGKPRQLHTELACDAIDYTFPNRVTPTALTVNDTYKEVVTSPYFTVDFVRLEPGAEHSVSHNGESFRIVMITSGSIRLGYEGKVAEFKQGTTVLIPAAIRDFYLKGKGNILVISC